MKKIGLVIDRSNPDMDCTGCRMCEVICSFFHEGVINPKKARIRVVSEQLIDVPTFCRQCRSPPCKDSCPVNALSIGQEGLIVADEETCIGCGSCVEACPFGAMFMHTDWKTPRACDLCGGEPKCVEYCPTKILKTYNSHDFPYRRKEYAKRYLKRALKQWGIEDIISEQKWSSDGSEKT